MEHEFSEKAIPVIQKFTGDDRAVRLISKALNPYSCDGRTMYVFEDEEEFEYWMDERNDEAKLIQVAPSANSPLQEVLIKDRMTVKDLRELAHSLINKELPGLDLSTLHPLEDNRDRKLYFFRFDDFDRPLQEDVLPPFVQVVLLANGKLRSFTNTINL